MTDPKDKPPIIIAIDPLKHARLLARVLAGEVFPKNPNIKPEHLRILSGDKTRH